MGWDSSATSLSTIEFVSRPEASPPACKIGDVVAMNEPSPVRERPANLSAAGRYSLGSVFGGLAEQLEGQLGHLVRLGEDRDRRLADDLGPGHGGGLGGDVDVTDTAVGGRQVVRGRLQVVLGVGQRVLRGTASGAAGHHGGDDTIDTGDERL